MFLKDHRVRIQENFEVLQKAYPQILDEVCAYREKCSDEEFLALQYLYTTMPLSDMGNYPAELFADYAVHSVRLWNTFDRVRALPEDIFLNYVLYHRVNTEEIDFCRTLFFEEMQSFGKEGWMAQESEKAIVQEVNFWCANEATYQTTDERTASARMVYETGRGRCGEESVFAVNACRSMGIPARQVYAPYWSHCDDNHAWVEVFADGQWYFFGACEPDPRLNRGWFNRAASRAITVHSRWYDESAICGEQVIGRDGLATIVNQTSRYTNTCPIELEVKNPDGTAAAGAVVRFQVLNYAELANVEQRVTDMEGRTGLEAGMGSILVEISGADGYAEVLLNTKDCKDVCRETVVLGLYPDGEETAPEWTEFNMYAPSDCAAAPEKISPEEKAAFDKRLAGVFENCRNKILNWKHPQKEAFLDVADEAAPYRAQLLEVLSEKDLRDFKSEILETHVQGAMEYAADFSEAERELFVKYVMNPRIYYEILTPFREAVKNAFSEEEAGRFRSNPAEIAAVIRERIRQIPERECGSIYAKPATALKMGAASEESQRILFVAIARTFGIPARLNPESLEMEYWKEGGFVSVTKAAEADSFLCLTAESDRAVWRYEQDWTLSQWVKGQWKTWKLGEKTWEDGRLCLELPSGVYRILTSNRLPNGNIFAGRCQFTLKKGEHKELTMRQREAQMSDLLSFYKVPDFTVDMGNGEKTPASVFTGEKRMLYIWLEEGMEPTEHILNELIEHETEFASLQDRIVFLMKSEEGLVDPTLRKCRSALPEIPVYYHDFGEEAELLARSVYTEPGRWPLIAVVQNLEQGLTALYGTSGYNVGTGDMILRIMSAQLK